MEDSRIVDLFWARSESAIDESNRKYGRMLQSISYSLLTSKEDAEECVNDTYLSAWQKMPTDRPDHLGAFLAKIVRCISIDRFRRDHRQKRGGAGSIIDELTECIPSGETVEQAFENGRLTETLNAFLRSLDREKRVIFTQRYFFSLPTAEIAAGLGIGEGKVKSVLFRLRGALRKILEEEELL